MFPLVAIGSVIGAVMSIAKGASWVAAQLDSTKAPASVGGTADAKPVTDAKASQFEAALAAQVAGQKAPVSSVPTANVPLAHGPDYDSLARMKAGVLAYSHVGEHRSNHGKPAGISGEDQPIGRS